MCSSINCKSCGFKSCTFDNFMDLSVSFPRKAIRYTGYIDVSELMKGYITPEAMERCGYKCSKCKGVDNMEKQITIFRYPKILCLHLKRSNNGNLRPMM